MDIVRFNSDSQLELIQYYTITYMYRKAYNSTLTMYTTYHDVYCTWCIPEVALFFKNIMQLLLLGTIVYTVGTQACYYYMPVHVYQALIECLRKAC